MPFVIALFFVIPIMFVAAFGWRAAALTWAVLFVGSGILKLLGLGF